MTYNPKYNGAGYSVFPFYDESVIEVFDRNKPVGDTTRAGFALNDHLRRMRCRISPVIFSYSVGTATCSLTSPLLQRKHQHGTLAPPAGRSSESYMKTSHKTASYPRKDSR